MWSDYWAHFLPQLFFVRDLIQKHLEHTSSTLAPPQASLMENALLVVV